MVNNIDDLLPKPKSVIAVNVDYSTDDSGSTGRSSSTNDQSSLSPAEQKSLEKQREMAGAPILPPPQQIVDYTFGLDFFKIGDPGDSKDKKVMTADEAKLMIDNMMMQATIKILTAWVDNLREIQDYKDQTTAIQKMKERVQESIRLGQKQFEENADDVQKDSIHFASYGLLVSAGMLAIGLGQGISPASLPSFVTMKEIGQVVSSVMPTALDGAVSSLVGLFGAGLVTQAAVMTLKSGDKGKKAYDYDFAKNYAIRTLQIVNGNEMDKTVEAIIGSDKALAAKKSTLAKIALLGQTLAFSYRLETGSLSGEELAGMLQGKIQFGKDDFRNDVLISLQTQLNQLPVSERSNVIEKLMAYYDSKPSLTELTEPANAVRSLFGKAPPQIISG